MLKHILLLFTIVASAVGYLTPTQVHGQDDAAPTIEEIIKQGDEITEERLAGYKDFDCGQIKAELTYVAGRYEYGATPRLISGTLFIGGDIRYLSALTVLNKVANEKGCEVRSIECSDYPLTCEAERGDYATAVRLMRALADQDVAAAQEAGAAYERGDYATALRFWRPLADQGNALAQTNLGVMYEKGQGVRQDYAEAVTWFRKAADQGYGIAADQGTAHAYAHSLGAAALAEAMMRGGRKAADQGVATAQNNLGLMYNAGRGVPQDYAEAVKWFREAADQGNALAQYNLGVMYAEGRGVPQDYVQAHKWLNLAAAHFPASETAARDLVAAKMTPAQIAEAQRLAREWKPK